MSLEVDEEILQDFLVEAEEALEVLNSSLVDLEQDPENEDLLNKVFRGFHNIKGGAGFLNIPALVDLCHGAEEVFSVLRQGERRIDAELMDVVLSSVDSVTYMMEQVQTGNAPEPADPALIDRLAQFAVADSGGQDPVADVADTVQPAVVETPSQPEVVAAEVVTEVTVETPGPEVDAADQAFDQLLEASQQGAVPDDVSVVTPGPDMSGEDYAHLLDAMDATKPPRTPAAPATAKSDSDEISDDEFESLLDELHGKGKQMGQPQPSATTAKPASTAPAAAKPDSDEISDDEFEKLLDDLHGKAKQPGTPQAPAVAVAKTPAVSDDINDDEFERLLDDLHGKGKQPGASQVSAADTAAVQAPEPASAAPVEAKLNSGEISDDEFESLLDDLHGKGKHAGQARAAVSTAKTATPSAPQAAAGGGAGNKPPAPPRPNAAGGGAKAAGGGVKIENSVRVDTKRLDDIMNMVGELVLVRNRFAKLRETQTDEAFVTAVGNLDVVTSDLQLAVMKTRMQPIKKVFARFPRLVRDLSRSLGKDVALEMQGEETDLDKNLVEALADPLIHLVRNAVDHGIESAEERVAKRKPAQATVMLTAEQEGDHIRLTVADDGAGIDIKVLRNKAVEKGLVDINEVERYTDQECLDLIFLPGFSTKQNVSNVSGRGVGMDVVKTSIAKLNGAIEIETEKDKGTRFYIKVPLTLAIMPTLMVMLGKRIYALPLLSIFEIIDYEPKDTKLIDGQQVVMVRGKPVPLFSLRRWLLNGQDRYAKIEGGHVVMVGVGAQRVGLMVDRLLGQEEVVIKPLGALLQGMPGLAGATITGSGQIALILDFPSLIRAYANRIGEVA
ncbi:MAG: chemotaxis protein CheA [Gammaproteobacteria bacterium]|nr:chemotaxis protein CheA [Gammaproteobacteria bacterium]